ncbi:hypothetical protein Y032_0031g2373 [Ancylostoma ceylanicum]|uniref:Uncharacterized protein n=1 Tax=Ancylostoma ceylanicum TaxID=53326 RepID=A0A016URZ6_9BILA|nr:hypothetical protein Y032_0031g2373 [Ancylostoma ceylanicum]
MSQVDEEWYGCGSHPYGCWGNVRCGYCYAGDAQAPSSRLTSLDKSTADLALAGRSGWLIFSRRIKLPSIRNHESAQTGGDPKAATLASPHVSISNLCITFHRYLYVINQWFGSDVDCLTDSLLGCTVCRSDNERRNTEMIPTHMRTSTELIILLNILPFVHAVGFFESLCTTPFFFGSGKLEGLQCHVVYPMTSQDAIEAFDMCARTSPYEVISYTHGYSTRCTYEKTYKCDDEEISLDNQCFMVKNHSKFSTDEACGKSHKLHTIQSRDEVKWVSVLMEHATDEIWVGNEGKFEKILKPTFADGTTGDPPPGTRIKLRLSTKYSKPFAPRGSAFYENVDKKLPHLCSRPAIAYEKTLDDIRKTVESLGFPTTAANDNLQAKRPFTYLPTMVPIRGPKFEPDVQELHSVCALLPNGYAASLFDFFTIDDFRAARKNFPGLMYRTTISRIPSFNSDPQKTCVPMEEYESHRKRWTYYSSLNTTSVSV